jgi:murein DD-endopeptidase MepM/ murein hydrolase activator NlpD
MFLRIAAACIALALVWAVAGARAPGRERLPLAAMVPGAVETLPFGCTSLALEPFDPFCPGLHIHTGVDLAVPAGTPVHAAAAGIAFAGFDLGRAGIYVSVMVDPHTRLLYCHLLRVHVIAGESVAAGQVIGEVGATGAATGAHLHFEVQVDGRAIDPVAWLGS